MRIGIHSREDSFSEYWIEYCEVNDIKYKLVDCYSSNIMNQLSDCDTLMWHFNHKSPKASKFAKQLLYSVEASGKKVFPDYHSVWHFDDKVGQKYLLEAIGAPLAPSNVFYSRQEALKWANQTVFPKVFKLRNGAGASNVRLVKTKFQANRLVRKAFGRGFKQSQAFSDLKERYRKYSHGKSTIWDVLKGIVRIVLPTEYARVTGREIGYIYFQDFIPGNDHDIRVIVIGDKAFAMKRMVRKNDFRASGSGVILFGREHNDDETVRLAFETSEKLNVQCMAYDFVYQAGKPLIIEISFATIYDNIQWVPGFWKRDLSWHEEKIDSCGWMVENLVQSMNIKD